MKPRILLPACILLTATTLRGEEPKRSDYSELKRLHSAMMVSSFPTPTADGIQLWIQHSSSRGTSRTADLDQWPVSATPKFFAADCLKHDLKNIAIISKNGLSVRFVDILNEDPVVTRGDVVAILLSERAE